MRQIKLLNGFLWFLNVLLGLGIFVFAVIFLIIQKSPNHLENVREEAPGGGPRRSGQQQLDFSVLRNLPNPVVPRSGTDGPKPKSKIEQEAKFLGGYRIEDRADSEVAFLQVIRTGQYVNAYRGETIRQRGQVVAELQGWTLKRLTASGAVFTDGQMEVELRRDDLVASMLAPAGGGARKGKGGKEFDLAGSGSKKTASTDNHESWVIDRDEIDWAFNNVEQLLSEVALSPYSSGGVKIDAAGGFASQRGLLDGDVIKKVNGFQVKDPMDLRNLANNPQFRNAGAMVIEIERAGRVFTIDFRPERRAPNR